MVKLFDVHVNIVSCRSITGLERNVNMLAFTGYAEGEYFNGKIADNAVDTQFIEKNGEGVLSARYMLEGKDKDGNACSVFIENNGNPEKGLVPTVISDSPVLGAYESKPLKAEMTSDGNGIIISVFTPD